MKRFIVWAVIGVIALSIWALTWTNSTTYVFEPVKEPQIKAEIQKPELRKELIKICTCESGQGTGKPQQYDIKTGEVLRGVKNPKDIGMCQINLYWNGATAEKMGLDLFKESDNITFANWLYETQGSEPWSWSRACWNQ